MSYRLLYIPHGSDERGSGSYGYIYVSGLYIPHGSDESEYWFKPDVIEYLFISHMVQMKGTYYAWFDTSRFSFISHMVQMKDIVVEPLAM